MKYAFGNAQDIGQREAQQDAFGFSDPENPAFCVHGGFLAVLADGMGGLERGELASRAAVKVFIDTYLTKSAEEEIPQALARALIAAQQRVLELAAQAQLGTTLVAAVLHEASLYWISVGDSALYHVRGNELTQINRPHVYSLDLDARVLAGELSLEVALADPQRESLTSYLGMANLQLVDRNLRPMPIKETDGLLLASDGLFKTIAPANFHQRNGDPQDYCEQLMQAALAACAPGQDNITILMLEPAHVREFIEPVIIAPQRKWGQWAAVVVLLLSGVAAAYWAGEREKKPVTVSAPSTAPGKERFDNSKLPPVNELREP
ncbi:MAG: protein phosphatase 2C domain-containing protein [Acidobacteria bacterium]|nr:protein phosphatase 2C domain-containing protein [Acidobacteriota bacterium]